MRMKSLFLAAVVCVGPALASTRTIDSASINPNTVAQGSGVLVTVTAEITDPTVYSDKVTLVTADSTHKVLAYLSKVGPTTFQLVSTFPSLPVGTYYLQVSAAFQGSLVRKLSTLFTFTIQQATPNKDCFYTVRGGTPTVPMTGELGRIYVTAPPGCGWSASLNPAAAWVTLTSSSGQGNGVVAYQVAANGTGLQRSTILEVGGYSLPITQVVGATLPGSIFFAGPDPGWPGLFLGPASGSAMVSSFAPLPVGSTESWFLTPTQTAPIGMITSGTLNFSLQGNSASLPRLGRIVAGGQTMQVLQKGTGGPSGFVDIPTASPYDHYDQYIKLVAGGPGSPAHCATGLAYFCPEANITRGEMALLLVRALMGDSFSYNTTPYFTDVTGSNPQFPYVQFLADWIGVANISCGSGAYCPNALLTRGQMAEMLMRARYNITGTFPAFYTETNFADIVPASQLSQFVHKLQELGMTRGCASTNDAVRRFCPNDPVNRGFVAMVVAQAVLAP